MTRSQLDTHNRLLATAMEWVAAAQARRHAGLACPVPAGLRPGRKPEDKWKRIC